MNMLQGIRTTDLLPQPDGFRPSGSAPLALDDVVDVEDLRLAGLDPDIGQQWHQALPESFPLLPRIPYFADSEASVHDVGAVVVHAVRRKVTALLQPADALLVLLYLLRQVRIRRLRVETLARDARIRYALSTFSCDIARPVSPAYTGCVVR